MPGSHRRFAVALAVASALAQAAPASAQVGESLVDCQKTVASASTRYIQSLSSTISACLRSISTGVVQEGVTPDAAATTAAEDCVKDLRRILNSEAPDKELGNMFTARVDDYCDPATNPKLAHTEADIVTVGANKLSAGSLGAYCSYFGGDGSVDSYAEWRDCIRRSAECQARQAVASQWPRALEYFEALQRGLLELPSDRARDDARVALVQLDTAIEGGADDNQPGIVCGGQLDGTVLWSEVTQCRQRWLELRNGSAVGPCPDSPYQQDGMMRAGQPRSYRDNADGTVSDLVTGLMWEKLGTDSSVHNQLLQYTWTDAFQKIDALNAGAGFAGHKDWRLPNRRELISITIPNLDSPSANAVFETNCHLADCSNVECSCTVPFPYWTSTTYQPTPTSAWQVDFWKGLVAAADKSTPAYVRAVRTGR